MKGGRKRERETKPCREEEDSERNREVAMGGAITNVNVPSDFPAS